MGSIIRLAITLITHRLIQPLDTKPLEPFLVYRTKPPLPDMKDQHVGVIDDLLILFLLRILERVG